MSAATEQRTLAATMFTDILGYGALSQRDEVFALHSVPQGRSTIAQRFIAGLRRPEHDKPRRGDRTSISPWRGLFLSPFRGFGATALLPSDNSLGFSLSPSGLLTAGPTRV